MFSTSQKKKNFKWATSQFHKMKKKQKNLSQKEGKTLIDEISIKSERKGWGEEGSLQQKPDI